MVILSRIHLSNHNRNIKVIRAMATKIIKHNNIYQKTNKTKTTNLNNKTTITQPHLITIKLNNQATTNSSSNM
jgi:hypothetical protein